jgi:branched-chain amino acid transport system permease protein
MRTRTEVRRHRWAILGVAVAVLLLTLVLKSAYYQLVLSQVLLWAVLSLAWNILSGYSGYFSFGHASFWGLGAYTVALGMIYLDLTPWVTIPFCAVVGAVAGALIGYPTFRLKGHYFALAMLAYPLATLYVFQWLGYQELTLPMKRDAAVAYMQFSDPRAYVVLALALLVVTLLISLKVENSRFGMSLLAIKQNEPAAEAAGIDTWRWKMLALMLSGALAATAGGLYGVVLLVVTPETVFGMLVSAQALILALFGGVGSLWGPLIGAVVLVPLAEGLNAELGDVLPGIQGVVYGIAIILIILRAPEGVYWRGLDWFTGSRPVPRPAAVSLRVAIIVPAAHATALSGVMVYALIKLDISAAKAALFALLGNILTFAIEAAAGAILGFAAAFLLKVAVQFVLARKGSLGSAEQAPVVAPPDISGTKAATVKATATAPAVEVGDLLVLRGIGISFGGLRALHGVDLTVPEGGLYGIIGPNGAGKTTLFNVINGFLAPDSGAIEFAGAPLMGLPPNRVCRRGIGRTFQVVRAFPRMTVLENVIVGAFVGAPSDALAEQMALAALDRVGLSGRANAIAGGLTTRELRLMELARALVPHPRLMLLDETLAGLGHDDLDGILGVIRQVRADGVTVLIIEHTMQAMVELVDHFSVLDHGQVIATGKPETVVRDQNVIEAYLGKKWAEQVREVAK